MDMSFEVAPAPYPAATADDVRSHPAYVGRVGSQAEWQRRASRAVVLYGELYAEPAFMTRRSMTATRRLRSQLRRTARRAARRVAA